MPLRVHLRPNVPYLLFTLIAVMVIVYGGVRADVFGVLIAVAGGLLLGLFGIPVVVSTVCRVPVIVVDDDGVRLPLMGVRLRWHDITRTGHGTNLDARLPAPLLLIVPADPDAALRQVRPWLRQEARANLSRHGTPVVISGLSIDHSLDDIVEAVRRHRRVS